MTVNILTRLTIPNNLNSWLNTCVSYCSDLVVCLYLKKSVILCITYPFNSSINSLKSWWSCGVNWPGWDFIVEMNDDVLWVKN